jgi:hypothetical protein
MAKKTTSERALLYLRSRLWVEGRVHIESSQGVLDFANDRDCNFIPLTDVTVYADTEAGTITIDFLAVNVEEVSFMTTYIGDSDPVFRERISQMLVRQPGRPQEDSLGPAVRDLVTWLGDDVVGRLNTCLALLGNGRADDRITGVKLVVNQLVSDIQEHTDPFENKRGDLSADAKTEEFDSEPREEAGE